MKITTVNETYTITPTEHKSVSIGPSLFVRKMFNHLDLSSLFTPLKKRGIDISALVEANIAYKTTENFSMKCAHAWIMQPAMRQFYNLKEFNERTQYRLLDTLGENFDVLIKGIQQRIFSRYSFDITDINLDWTSICLHGTASPLGKYGYSRDHRPDKLQLTLGITELTKPNNIPIGVTVKAGNVNDMTHFKSTFLQSQKCLKKGSLIIFDKGADSISNLDTIEALGHDYLTAKKFNKSDDKILDTFWKNNPILLNSEEKRPNHRIFALVRQKRSSTTYYYFSEHLEQQNLDAVSRKAYRKFTEAETFQNCAENGRKIPKKYRLSNPLVKITYTVQTLLKEMDEEEAISFLKKELRTGREGFFALTSSRKLTAKEALKRYREKDSIEKIFHSLKNEIEIKPLRVWTENCIRGAILIGFLAQLFVSLARFEITRAKHMATKFILKSLEKLTLTVMQLKNGTLRAIYSNFDALNLELLGLKAGVG